MGSFSMATAKDQLKVILESQPDDSTSEEIVRELAFHVMVQRGLADSDAGRAISNVEMGRRIQSWQQ
jgi:predicted transcriptional regulator